MNPAPLWELINPSDPYTFRARSTQAATVAMLFLSHLACGGKPVDPACGLERTPMCPFGLTEEGMRRVLADEGISDLDEWLKEHREEVAEVLESVEIGRPEEQEELAEATSLMSPEDAAEYRAKWRDKRRSSMNNIGARAQRLAEMFRQ